MSTKPRRFAQITVALHCRTVHVLQWYTAERRLQRECEYDPMMVKIREDYKGEELAVIDRLDIFVTSIYFELPAVLVKILDREWA
jgi:hypothetical protein